MGSFSLLPTQLLRALAALFLDKGGRTLPPRPWKLFVLHEVFVLILSTQTVRGCSAPFAF